MDEPVSDYDDVMGAVEDGYIEYDEVHCKHGTFVGTAGGPDYMCGHCEMGTSDEDYEAMLRWRHERITRKAEATRIWDEEVLPARQRGELTDEQLLDWLRSDVGKNLFA